MQSLLIIAAGNGSRMGNINIPKALFPVNGKPNIHWLLESTNGMFSEVIVVARKGYGNYFKESLIDFNVSVVEIESGLGDGHAVKSSLDFVSNKYTTVVWGDLYCPSSKIFTEINEFLPDTMLVPVALEKNPYVHFDIDSESLNISCANFSKFGEHIDEGFHDQSIFKIRTQKIREELQNLHDSFFKNGKYITATGELNFLHLVHMLYNKRTPAVAYITNEILSSYNTLDEVQKIQNEIVLK